MHDAFLAELRAGVNDPRDVRDALLMMMRIAENLRSHPDEGSKFRKVKRSSTAFFRSIGRLSAALACFQAALSFQPSGGEDHLVCTLDPATLAAGEFADACRQALSPELSRHIADFERAKATCDSAFTAALDAKGAERASKRDAYESKLLSSAWLGVAGGGRGGLAHLPRDVQTGLVGLCNLGATCYMNALLQVCSVSWYYLSP
jgi:hypothetical protein